MTEANAVVVQDEPLHPVAATSLMQALASAASNPGTDMDKMERLFAMHQTMLKQQAETDFNAAMARAQAKIEPVAHNAVNTHTNSRYAKLAAIARVITPIYTAEGLSISFDSADCPKPDLFRTIALVSHSRGHTRTYHLDLALDAAGVKGNSNKTAVQASGSTNSYARRYLMCMIFNVTTEDDTDGNKPVHEMGTDLLADFHEQIAALDKQKEAEALWQTIAAACTKSGDVAAYDELKKALAAKVKALKAAQSETV